ncbi:MAG: phosphate acetyltransferase [Phycisphaerales bacterium]|nr:MAG: phosphate acetyltransferase [Phycisphaerales bacterium]
MSGSLFICSTDQEAGSSVVTLGLFGVLRKTVDRLAFLKPVGGGADDQDVAVMRSTYRLSEDAGEMCPLTIERARELVARQQEGNLLDRIDACFKKLRAEHELVLLEGINNTRATSAFDMDINEAIAGHLDTPVLLVARGSAGNGVTDVDQLVATVTTAKRSFEDKSCEVVGVVVNRVVDHPFEDGRQRIADAFEAGHLPLFGVVPNLAFLGYPKLDQVVSALRADVLSGEEYLSNVVTKTIVAAMEPRHFLSHLDTDRTLVITPGDREAILMAVACAQKSDKRRSVSGIVLTGGLRPDPEIMTLVEDLGAPRFPILAVKTDTFTTASRIQAMDVRLRVQDEDKIYTASSAIWRHLDHERLWDTLKVPRPKRRKAGAQVFLEQLIEQARTFKNRIVLPEGDEPRTVRAAARMLELGVCQPILIGDPEAIAREAKSAEVKLDGATFLCPSRSDKVDSYAEAVVEIRKKKKGGMTPEVARAWLDESPIHFGTVMVQVGDADGLVSGAVHSTGDTIRPALQIIGTKPEVGVASSIFFMALPDRVLVYGDCAIVPDPNAHELAAIAWSSARTARAFGIEPYVAMLSYSTGKSGAGQSVDKVSEATQLLRERNPDFAIDGPLQYDAAIDPEVGRLKQPGSPVAGRANVFIFPDLDAGNIAYKAVQRSARALAVGPVLQGLNKPVNDLSRGCSVDDIVYVAAITAIQAGAK